MPTSSRREQLLTAFAIAILLGTLGLTWSVADVRTSQAADAKRADLVERTVTEQRSPNDYDGDGITDGQDRCPTRPETDNGYRDDDGCPDVVASTGAS